MATKYFMEVAISLGSWKEKMDYYRVEAQIL
jgi:hypothetical protein